MRSTARHTSPTSGSPSTSRLTTSARSRGRWPAERAASSRCRPTPTGEGYGPWAGEVTHRTSGVLVADRGGASNAYALFNLQERAELLIGAGEEVYEGMVVGENSRSGDMDVNPTKEKKLTNIRTHAHDEALRLTPPRPLTLESAIEFIAADELVEVTPRSIRLRKRTLSSHDRRRERSRDDDLRRAADAAD